MIERPNILLVIVHDLGTHLGCYGHRSVDSPNLDRMAAQGVRFGNNFATATFCSPSRGAIFTGKHPHVNGLMGLVNLDWDLAEGQATLAQVLGAAGYETRLFGMQHETQDPARLGFHHTWDRSDGIMSAQVTPAVCDFLRGRKPDDGPFYARVGFFEVHRPYHIYEPKGADALDVPPFLEDTPGCREDLARFHECIRIMDAAVGELLTALDGSAVADNTLVVFTTDHGPAFPRAKGTLYDPGIRTTLLMRGPDEFSGGRTHRELMSNVDLFPTLAELCGTETPDGLTGRSFLPLLRGGKYEPNRTIFSGANTVAANTKRCIRTERYKYIRNYDEGPLLQLPVDIETSLTRRDMGNDHLAPRPPVEMYDLEKDQNEMHNLAGDAAHAEVEQQLATDLAAFQEASDDPLLRGPISRPPGEADVVTRIYANLELDKRSPYPRDGLLSAQEWQEFRGSKSRGLA